MGFSRWEYWSGLPFPSPGDLSHLGIKPRSPALQAEPLGNRVAEMSIGIRSTGHHSRGTDLCPPRSCLTTADNEHPNGKGLNSFSQTSLRKYRLAYPSVYKNCPCGNEGMARQLFLFVPGLVWFPLKKSWWGWRDTELFKCPSNVPHLRKYVYTFVRQGHWGLEWFQPARELGIRIQHGLWLPIIQAKIWHPWLECWAMVDCVSGGWLAGILGRQEPSLWSGHWEADWLRSVSRLCTIAQYGIAVALLLALLLVVALLDLLQ